MMNDEIIIRTAEQIDKDIPVFPKRIYEKELKGNDYNYIIIRKPRLEKNNCQSYTRTIEIIYVYDGIQKINDYNIINAFSKIGLVFKNMETDDFQIGSTNKWIDMNIYSFERPEKG